MRQRGSELKTPPFFRKMALVKACHLSVLALTYGLALLLFPTISQGLSTRPYFDETYLGCIAASIALSVIALACGSGMRLYVVFLLRCYLLVVLGYSIGGALSVKLVLGMGLMVEIGFLVDTALQSRVRRSRPRRPCTGPGIPVFFGQRASPTRFPASASTSFRRSASSSADSPWRPHGSAAWRAPEGARRDHPHPGGQPRRALRAQPQPSGLRENRGRRVLGCASGTA